MIRYERTFSRSAVACAAVLAMVLSPALARDAFADSAKDRARSHYVKGKGLYDRGEYKAAIAEFAAADGLAPAPLLEFNIALCHEKLGDTKEAVRRYRVYLDRDPNATNRQEVEQKIQQMEAGLKTAAEARRADERAKQKPAAPPTPPPAEPPPPAEAGRAPPPATGDPELDRAGAIDVAAIRDQRQGSAAPDSAAPPPPNAGGRATAEGSPPIDGGKKKSKPVYKKWWFWVIVGVSAVILIDIATSDSQNAATLQLPDVSGSGNNTSVAAPVLLRF